MKEKDKKQKDLIQAYNMGWFGFPKYIWRRIGLYSALVGFLMVVILPFTPDFVLPSKQAGFVILLIGALISTVNG